MYIEISIVKGDNEIILMKNVDEKKYGISIGDVNDPYENCYMEISGEKLVQIKKAIDKILDID